MDSRQLSYFRAVVDHGSFTQAADALEMTQPSLSLSIRKLEKELDVQLLSRGRAGVSTTEAGDYLYKVAAKMETLMTDADQRIREIANGAAGNITINSAPEFNWAFMPEVLYRMREASPDVRIFLDDPEPTITLQRVLDGTSDLGLMPSTDPLAFAQQWQDDLVVHVAAEFPFVVGIPERLAHLPDPVSLVDIATETWILPPRNPQFVGLPETLDKIWEHHPSAVPKHVQEISTLQTGIPLVAGGVGVCLFPDSVRNQAGSRVLTRGIEEDFPAFQAVLLYRKDKDLSPAANHLVDTILEVGSEYNYSHVH